MLSMFVEDGQGIREFSLSSCSPCETSRQLLPYLSICLSIDLLTCNLFVEEGEGIRGRPIPASHGRPQGSLTSRHLWQGMEILKFYSFDFLSYVMIKKLRFLRDFYFYFQLFILVIFIL